MENSISNVEAGFAKLQGMNFEYYMQTYSIILGRNSKEFIVDLDLTSLGGGKKISRQHARIFFDFTCRRFALEVLGKNGCFVQGMLHLPGNPMVKLNSQDLIQIGDIKFYFLLPLRNILARPNNRKRVSYEDQYNAEDCDGSSSKKKDQRDGNKVGSKGKALMAGTSNEKSEGKSSAENLQLQQSEENDVTTAIVAVLSDLCHHGQWIPMDKLHAELVAKYSTVWHQNTVKKYLTSESSSSNEYKGKPWNGLLALLKKYPKHFDITTKTNGRVIMEFVTRVSQLS
ncbi:unnamed protein product [Lupinus luteus]|uniref:FHA domain-containing protein n=1 Tax=Lupinus luteus TaxID=3873 RepID=A0AAV1W116_LUPLU